MEIEEVDRLISYHQDGLDQYLLQMSPSAQALEANTIKALKELKCQVDNMALISSWIREHGEITDYSDLEDNDYEAYIVKASDLTEAK